MTDRELVRVILGLQADIAALRRMVNGVRFGTVKKVDAENGAAQLLLSDASGREFLSPMRPWGELSGQERSWRPPSEGQQMMMLAPHGDMRQGIILPMTFSDANPAPSGDAGARILSQFGSGRMLFDGGGARGEFSADRVDLGAGGGKAVARLGDKVEVGGVIGQIIEGSDRVFAAD